MNAPTTLRCAIYVCAAAACAAMGAPAAWAQESAPADGKAAAAQATPAQPAPTTDEDSVLKPGEPDFTLVALPTSLRMPKYKGSFRVTHRFLRPLDQGDFGDLASDFFGIDNGAQIGLEFRFGIVRGGQVGIQRTSDQTIAFLANYDVPRLGRAGIHVTAIASIEGTNNFRDSYSPALGAVISRVFGEHGAVYLEPIWVNNTNSLPAEVVDHNDTFMVGVGVRVAIRPTVYLVGEISPRTSGFKPGVNQGSVAIEKRVGGHVFQLNFSNGIGTTMAQVARGGSPGDHWYMGFNISRKFF